MMGSDFILLKWGTLKGWDLSQNERAKEIIRKYLDLGASMSAMAQRDTPEQKALIRDLINCHTGDIVNDWSGEHYTKEQAIEYIDTYGNG